jgi:hypothetical protein
MLHCITTTSTNIGLLRPGHEGLIIIGKTQCKGHIRGDHCILDTHYKGHAKEDAAHVVGPNKSRIPFLEHSGEDNKKRIFWGVDGVSLPV